MGPHTVQVKAPDYYGQDESFSAAFPFGVPATLPIKLPKLSWWRLEIELNVGMCGAFHPTFEYQLENNLGHILTSGHISSAQVHGLTVEGHLGPGSRIKMMSHFQDIPLLSYRIGGVDMGAAMDEVMHLKLPHFILDTRPTILSILEACDRTRLLFTPQSWPP